MSFASERVLPVQVRGAPPAGFFALFDISSPLLRKASLMLGRKILSYRQPNRLGVGGWTRRMTAEAGMEPLHRFAVPLPMSFAHREEL